MGFATTVLRLVTGVTMAGHGLQKLTTSFGGHGPEAAGEGFEKMGFQPGRPFATATGLAETAGGTLMALGLGTPVACAMVSGVMTGAIAKVHLPKGFWANQGGFEYNMQILASTFAVAGAGGGALTLDGLRGKKHRGLGWAFLQLAVGAGAAVAALAVSERRAGAGEQRTGTAGAGTGAGHDNSSASVDLSDERATAGNAELRS